MFNTSIGSRDGRCRRWRIPRQRWPAPRRPPFILNFEFIRLFFSVTGDLPQAQGAKRVRRQIPINAQAVIALVARNRASRLRANDTVDLSTVITLARQSLLHRGHSRVTRLIGVAILIVVLFAVVVIRIVSVRVTVGAVAISVSVIIIRIPIRPSPPRPKSDVEYHPRTVEEVATMPVPDVITAAVPIAVPVRRMLREDVIMPVRRKIISVANLTATGSVACHVCDRLIFTVRKTLDVIAAIHICTRELASSKRAAHVRIHRM